MTAITMDKVKLTGIMNIDRVLQFTAHAIANEHAHMYFEGIVAAADGREYMSMPMAGQEMQLKCDVEGTDKPYFAGQVLRAVIAEEGGLFTVKCECISGSYRFDLSKKSRSFQYTPTTYAEMFKWIQDKDKIGNILVIKGADTQIGYPIIQYEETDWEFAKRMAGHFGTVVLPEITDGFPQMSVGVIKGNTYEIGENSRYEEGKRIAAYRKKNPVSPCALTDFRTIRVMNYRNFELGDKVNFKGETWIVMGKEIRMVQSLLEVWYVLGLEQGYGLPKHYNAHISGMSILGEVIYTDHENLKIHLDIDEKQDVEKAYKYTWMPATGNLMYCMPKLGTRVSLYMPDSHEGNAYATECVRTNGGTACGEMADYNVRQFLTEHDKRMTMAPASMQFVGSSKENNNIVRLEDEKGLYFDSQQPIYMQSGGNFIVSAGGKVNVQSNKNIVVHKSRVKSGFELSGSEVNIYAKKFYRNGQTSGAAGPLAAETASGTPFPFGLMIGALLAMLPFAANPNDDSSGGKQPANTGANDGKKEATKLGLSIDDWKQYGLNGLGITETELDYTDEQLAKNISNIALGKYQDKINDPTLPLVSRIARVLTEELSTSPESMDAIAWNMLTKTINQNKSLYEVVTDRGSYEIFRAGNAQFACNPLNKESQYYSLDGWNHSLDVAKALVSVACNPDLPDDAKVKWFEEFVPCPYDPKNYRDENGNLKDWVVGIQEPISKELLNAHVAKSSAYGKYVEGEHGWIKIGFPNLYNEFYVYEDVFGWPE